MRRFIGVSLLAGIARADTVDDHARDSVEQSIDEWVEKLFIRSQKTPASFNTGGMENATLGKTAALRPAAARPVVLYVADAPHARLRATFGVPSRISARGQSSFLSGQRLVTPVPHAPRFAATPRASVQVQANLFARFWRVITSTLDGLVGSLEDPEKVIDQTVSEMQTDIARRRQEASKFVASFAQAEAKYKKQEEETRIWLKRAELALAKGDDVLAKEAIKRKQTSEDLAKQFNLQMQNQKKAVDQMQANMKLLEKKVEDAKLKKEALKARWESARTSKALQDLVLGSDGSSALAAFDKMEDKVRQLEGEVEATAALKAPEEDLEKRFAALETGGDIEDELLRLKAGQLKSGSPPKAALTSGRPVRDAIDMDSVERELEAIRRKNR